MDRFFVQGCPGISVTSDRPIPPPGVTSITQCDLRRTDFSYRGVLVSVWPAKGRFLVQGCLSIIQCDLWRTDSSSKGVLVSVWPATGRSLVQGCPISSMTCEGPIPRPGVTSITQCDLRRTDFSYRGVPIPLSVIRCNNNPLHLSWVGRKR